MNTALIEYFPQPSEVPSADVLAVRTRLEAYCQSWWPDLDTRPGSVFGDLYLTTLATMMTASETARQRMANDTNLDSIAQGSIYNVEAVQAYMGQFSQHSGQRSVPASGMLKLTFTTDQDVTLPDGLTFDIDGAKARLVAQGDDVITIRSSRSTLPGPRIFTDTENFGVYVAVIMDEPIVIREGIVATPDSDLTDEGFLSAVAIADFFSGSPTESLPDAARELKVGYAAAGYTTVAGIRSLIGSQVPEAMMVHPIRSGDASLRRATTNALGLGSPMVDLYVRGYDPATSVVSVVLTYSTKLERWQGRLPDGLMPLAIEPYAAVGSASSPENNRGSVTVLGRTRLSDANAWLLGNSPRSEYGLQWSDASPENFQPSELQPAIQTYGPTIVPMGVVGEYEGSAFQGGVARSLSIRIQQVDATHVIASVVDLNQGLSGVLKFLKSTPSGVYLAQVEETDGYIDFLNGLTLTLSAGEDFSTWVGNSYKLDFSGRTASFQVRVTHDMAAQRAAALVDSKEYGPAGAVDVLVKSFFLCLDR